MTPGRTEQGWGAVVMESPCVRDESRRWFGRLLVRLAVPVLSVAACGAALVGCSSGSGGVGASPPAARSSATSLPASPGSASPSSSASGLSTSSVHCPPASVVDAALGQSNSGPVATAEPFGETCVYKGTGIIPTKIEFQTDTAATFAASEQAVATLNPVTVTGLGAGGFYAGGFLEVFTGQLSVKIVSPLSSLAEEKALVRELIR